mgnify:CR=1 FL=1
MARKHEDKWRLFQRADSQPALAERTRIEVLIAMDRVAGKLQPVLSGNSALEKEMGDKTDRLPRRTVAPLSCNNHLQDSGRSALRRSADQIGRASCRERV